MMVDSMSSFKGPRHPKLPLRRATVLSLLELARLSDLGEIRIAKSRLLTRRGKTWFVKLLDLAPDIGDAGHELFLLELNNVEPTDTTVAVNVAQITAVRAMTSAADAVACAELASRGLPLRPPHEESAFLGWRDRTRREAAVRAAERLVGAAGFLPADDSLQSTVEALFDTVGRANKVQPKNVRTGAYGWASALNTDQRPAAIETGDALQALAGPMAELARVPLPLSWAVLTVGPAADIIGRVKDWTPQNGRTSIPAVALLVQWMHLAHLDVPFDPTTAAAQIHRLNEIVGRQMVCDVLQVLARAAAEERPTPKETTPLGPREVESLRRSLSQMHNVLLKETNHDEGHSVHS